MTGSPRTVFLSYKSYTCTACLKQSHVMYPTVFYWSCTLAGVEDAKERDFRDWDMSKR